MFNLFFRLLNAIFFLVASIAEARQPSQKVKEAVHPYLIPTDHQIKSALDTIFSTTRATFNLNTLREAGFTKTRPRQFTKMLVTSHPIFPGFIFKLYLDSQRYHKEIPEYKSWILRVKGANLIRRKIADLHLESIFKVPHKWIYHIPEAVVSLKGYYPRYYLLVEEDMELLPRNKNKKMWASDLITPELLDQVFVILQELGLYDCAKPDNIPFSKDGRIAFVDTETFGSKKVLFKKMIPYLSKSNQDYWKNLTKK